MKQLRLPRMSISQNWFSPPQVRFSEKINQKLQQVIDEEDKTKPLNDDEIRKRLVEAGIPNLARRTVAKYRKLMNIPTARFRRKY